MVIKKYYFVLLLMNYSQSLFTMPPVLSFAVIRARLIRIACKSHFGEGSNLRIVTRLQACEHEKDLVLLLTKMTESGNIHSDNRMSLELVEQLAKDNVLTKSEIIGVIERNMKKDPYNNPSLSFAALDVLVSLGENKILMMQEVLPLLQEAINLCGMDSQYAHRVISLVQANVVTDADRGSILSFLRAAADSLKEQDSKSKDTEFEKQCNLRDRNSFLELVNVLHAKNLLTDDAKGSFFKEINEGAV